MFLCWFLIQSNWQSRCTSRWNTNSNSVLSTVEIGLLVHDLLYCLLLPLDMKFPRIIIVLKMSRCRFIRCYMLTACLILDWARCYSLLYWVKIGSLWKLWRKSCFRTLLYSQSLHTTVTESMLMPYLATVGSLIFVNLDFGHYQHHLNLPLWNPCGVVLQVGMPSTNL